MRATHRHTNLARAVCCVLAVAVITCLVAAPASASGGASKTPLDVYKRFAFESEVAMSTDDATPSITVSTKGVYVKPRAQECKATVSIGTGLSVSQRAVTIGDATWVGMGDGRLKKRSDRDAFEFADQCPSSPAFWTNFSFPREPGIKGTTESRGGIAVEHFDLAEVFDAVRGFIDEVPPDVTVERASVWRSEHDDVVVGVDLALHATSSETCHDMLELDPGDTAPTGCTMTIRFGLSRFDDPKLEVRAGGSSERINRT